MVLGLGAATIFAVARYRRRARALRAPFPEAWRRLLRETVPLYGRFPVELRAKLERETRDFLASVRFVGCGGLEVTDEMRVVIALQACLLTVGRDGAGYESLFSVLVYPDEFIVEESIEDEAGVVTEGSRALSGQAIDTDRIVLSWRDVEERGDEEGAYNVVLHEFAHYLDHEHGGVLSAADGARARAAEWHQVLDEEYRALCEAVERGEPTLIDPYGVEEPAEFFAVATETFFELPGEMLHRHARLYRQLQRFFGLDPASW